MPEQRIAAHSEAAGRCWLPGVAALATEACCVVSLKNEHIQEGLDEHATMDVTTMADTLSMQISLLIAEGFD